MLGCCIFDHVEYHNNGTNLFETLCPYMGGTDFGAKRLVKYYVKPDVLFCVALKVRAGHHLFG